MTNTREQQFIARIAELEAENQALRARVTELEQQVSKPLVTPTSPPKSPVPGFVKPKRQKRRRKKPGQKPGHAGSYRRRPTEADEIVETPLEDCPHCHGVIENVTTHQQYVEEVIPAQTTVVCYQTQSGYCQNCQRRVESRHPQQVPHRLIGPRALLIAAELKHAMGVPYRKVVSVLERLCGLSVTAGALAQSMQSLAKWFTPEYQAIQTGLRQSHCTYVDETGWRLNGQSCWLWAFTTDSYTVYEVNASRGHQVVLEQLGTDYDGVLVSDFYTAYNPLPYTQQKCLVHLLRELSDVRKTNHTPEYAAFARKLTRLLRDAIRLKQKQSDFSQSRLERRFKRLNHRLEKLAKADYHDPDCQRLAKRLAKHSDSLFTFLSHMQVAADNNRAERAIRPAVVTRKISGGNRSPNGSEALGIITSVIQTCKQQNKDFVEVGLEIIRRYHQGLDAGVLTVETTAPT